MPECLWHVSSAHLEPFSIQFCPSFQMLEILCNCTACNCSTSFSEKIRVFFGYHETKWPYANRNDHWRHYELWPPRRAGFVKDPTKVLQRFTTCPEFTKTTTHLTVEAQQQDNLNTNSSAREKGRKIYIYMHLFQVSWSIVLTDQRLHLAFMLQTIRCHFCFSLQCALNLPSSSVFLKEGPPLHLSYKRQAFLRALVLEAVHTENSYIILSILFVVTSYLV